ncbi:hypothetical protein GCM10020358_60380 [Amorphoplanes nipponensis]|uniref:Uncharacterized protein n=1 Tax=Actinoplanes nipponensis TaxID=135950 RepID=A0A919MF71_9ACTN|nr:hypothetical protein [Actinoplanes nipponensis]GIE47209.1 hypothetical protein Ani05nite_07430 [Actinoplanes nipponensis]
MQEQVDELLGGHPRQFLAASSFATEEQAEEGVRECLDRQAQVLLVGREQLADGVPGGGLRGVAAG